MPPPRPGVMPAFPRPGGAPKPGAGVAPSVGPSFGLGAPAATPALTPAAPAVSSPAVDDAAAAEARADASAASEASSAGDAAAVPAEQREADAAADAALLPGLPVGAVPIDVGVTEAAPAEEQRVTTGALQSKTRALQWLERVRDATTSGEALAAARVAVGRGLGWFDTRAKAAVGAFVLGIVFTLTAQALFGGGDASERTSAESGRQPKSAAAEMSEGAHGKSGAAKPPAKTADEPSKGEKSDDDEAAQSTGEQTPEDNAAEGESSEQAAASDNAGTTAKPAAKPPKFNQDAAVRALSAAAGRAAKCGGNGTSGKGKVHVSYANGGKVSGVKIVSGKFDSKTASCVKRAFQGARIPAFSGKGTAMSKGFTVK